MYGFKTLASLNAAFREAGLGRYQFTEDEWTYGVDSRTAYTLAYLNVEAVLRNHKAAQAAAVKRPRRRR